jgi:hypothetical protein
MKTRILLALVAAFFLIYGCQSGAKREDSMATTANTEMEKSKSDASEEASAGAADEMAMTDSLSVSQNEPAPPISMVAESTHGGKLEADSLLLSMNLSQKKIKKTAEMRFKVTKVDPTTAKIEALARRYGGYVVSSEMQSYPQKTTSVVQSADSVLVVTEFVVSNQLVIRVPFYNYDSVLTEISKLYTYLDYRRLKTEDVTPMFLRNKLKAESKAKYEKRINRASDATNNRLNDVVYAESQAAALADQAIENKVSNYELQDQIDYSTITMDIYQPADIHKEMAGNLRMSDYTPSFGQKIWDGLLFGWNLLKYLVIAIVYMWSVILVAAGIYYLVRFLVKRASRRKAGKE